MRFLCIFITFLGFLSAQKLSLKLGESRIFQINNPVKTVFASNPKVIDYKLIGTSTLAIYAKANGYGEIKVLGGSNGRNILLNIEAVVDGQQDDLDRIAKIIEEQNPGSSIRISALSPNNESFTGQRGYMISGSVPSEEARSRAYATAAAALGLSSRKDNVRKRDAVVTSTQGVQLQSAGGGSENLDFLEKVSVEGLIDSLKVLSKNQVHVRLIIADVEKSLIDKLGLDLNGGILSIPLLTQGKLSAGNINLRSIVEAINDDRVAKILATPNISVLSGQSASFQVISQFTPISTTVAQNGTPISSPQTPIDFGVSLTVQPRIFSEDKIVLNISQEVSNIQSVVNINNATSANLKKRRSSNVVELSDGDSFVLGGLIDEKEILEEHGLPLLGSIPYLGNLFKKTTKTTAKTELIAVVTVSLTKPLKGHIAPIATLDSRFLRLSFDRSNPDALKVVSSMGFMK